MNCLFKNAKKEKERDESSPNWWKISVQESSEDTPRSRYKNQILRMKRISNYKQMKNESIRRGNETTEEYWEDRGKFLAKGKKRGAEDNHDEKRASMIASSFYVAYKSFSGRTNYVAHP